MNKQTYTTEERTIAQFEAIALKKKGYKVDRIIEVDEISKDESIIAFGYNPSETRSIKTAITKNAKNVEEVDYEFIYWN